MADDIYGGSQQQISNYHQDGSSHIVDEPLPVANAPDSLR